MLIFADTAEIDALKEIAALGVLDGVTTNPTLIARSGRKFVEVIEEICTLCPGPISAEVVALDAETMITEGRKLAAVASNVVVKVPLTQEGLKATKVFSDEGIPTNVTLCFSVNQAMLAAKAGATYVSPFIGRLDDYGADGIDLIARIRTVYDMYDFDTQILAASIRNPAHVEQALLAGADCGTMPPSVIKTLYEHPLTAKGLNDFMNDWKKTGQSIL